ncbi:MAG: hypothetical protein IJ167_08540 [Lachnospiraceae bacterium]|nr:hypothetical protein [Lachnospiraceae bacterium]
MAEISFKERVRTELLSAVDLVIRRKAGAQLFDEIIVGDEISLNKYKDKIKSLISHSLLGEDEDSDNPCTD